MKTRSITKDLFKEFWRTARHSEVSFNRDAVKRLRLVHFSINQRAQMWDEITAHAQDGKVGYVREGMDCDCTQYRYEGVMDLPAGALVHQRVEEEHYAWLDGPESIYYRSPKIAPLRYRSADRALEAYEDGHPSTVYFGELEEM